MFLFNLRKKKEKQRPKKTRRAIVCRCVEEFPAFVGGNFLLFFIMFGKYRLPWKAFVSLSSSAGKQKKASESGRRKIKKKIC